MARQNGIEGSIELVLAQAIRDRRRVRLVYPPGIRVVEPHCLGVGSSNRFLLRAWQIFGPSRTENAPGWKLLTVDKIEGVQDAGQAFEPRPDYVRPDPAMTVGIVIEVQSGS
jgi:hypothetical protein